MKGETQGVILRKRSDTNTPARPDSQIDPRTQGRWSHKEHEKFIIGKLI
jgi:hypothetical protein